LSGWVLKWTRGDVAVGLQFSVQTWLLIVFFVSATNIVDIIGKA
jgi:hypothetical protein